MKTHVLSCIVFYCIVVVGTPCVDLISDGCTDTVRLFLLDTISLSISGQIHAELYYMGTYWFESEDVEIAFINEEQCVTYYVTERQYGYEDMYGNIVTHL